MRYQGGEAGGQANNPGGAQELQLQGYRGWSGGIGHWGRAEGQRGPLQGTELSLPAGRGAPEAVSKAKEDTLPKASHRKPLPVTEAAPPTADCGRVARMLPDLSQYKGSHVLTPGVCLV